MPTSQPLAAVPTKPHFHPNHPHCWNASCILSAVQVGDVNYQQGSSKAGWITPVPGGVGPMTICMLLKVRKAARRKDTSRI
eukprot:1156072-Pelagomonas_calceolata.AAC.6